MKRLVIIVSVLVNVVLLTAFVSRPALMSSGITNWFTQDSAAPARLPNRPSVTPATSVAKPSSTDLASLLATDDLPALIARLRAAGFPNHAIRAIVEAKLNERYEIGRLRALASADDPDAPFWKPRGPSSVQRVNEYIRALDERSKSTRELLRDVPALDTGDLTVEQRRQYGPLPPAKIKQAERIIADYAEMERAARAAMNGMTLPEDREKLGLLEREKRADLAALLTPQELEDYDMRNSAITSRLRPTLALFKVTEAEFREIYQVQQALTDRVDLATSRLARMTVDERTAFMQQRPIAQAELDAQMRATLGERRFVEFVRSGDRDYQQLVRLTERENLPAQTATRVYDYRDQVVPESVRISNDSTLSPDHKMAALQSLVQNARAQLVATLGQTAGESYAKSATWLGNIERNVAMIRARAALPPVTPNSTR